MCCVCVCVADRHMQSRIRSVQYACTCQYITCKSVGACVHVHTTTENQLYIQIRCTWMSVHTNARISHDDMMHIGEHHVQLIQLQVEGVSCVISRSPQQSKNKLNQVLFALVQHVRMWSIHVLVSTLLKARLYNWNMIPEPVSRSFEVNGGARKILNSSCSRICAHQ